MNFIETRGIIFKIVKYSESSIICDIYSKERGLISCIVSGVRSGKSSQKAVIYKPMNIVDVIIYDHNTDKLHRIKEINLAYHFQKINLAVVYSATAIFILEVARNSIKEREANYPLYTFLESFIIAIDESKAINPNIHLVFFARLSTFLGIAPMDNFSKENPCFNFMEGMYQPPENIQFVLDDKTSQLFFQVCQFSYDNPSLIQTNRSERNQLTEIWLHYYRHHIYGFKELNSFEILKMVL